MKYLDRNYWWFSSRVQSMYNHIQHRNGLHLHSIVTINESIRLCFDIQIDCAIKLFFFPGFDFLICNARHYLFGFTTIFLIVYLFWLHHHHHTALILFSAEVWIFQTIDYEDLGVSLLTFKNIIDIRIKHLIVITITLTCVICIKMFWIYSLFITPPRTKWFSTNSARNHWSERSVAQLLSVTSVINCGVGKLSARRWRLWCHTINSLMWPHSRTTRHMLYWNIMLLNLWHNYWNTNNNFVFRCLCKAFKRFE